MKKRQLKHGAGAVIWVFLAPVIVFCIFITLDWYHMSTARNNLQRALDASAITIASQASAHGCRITQEDIDAGLALFEENTGFQAVDVLDAAENADIGPQEMKWLRESGIVKLQAIATYSKFFTAGYVPGLKKTYYLEADATCFKDSETDAETPDDGSGDGEVDPNPEVEKWTITFDSRGGTIAKPISVIKGNSTDVYICRPTKQGYYFDGWELDGIKIGHRFVPDSDVTLGAIWNDCNDGSGVCDPDPDPDGGESGDSGNDGGEVSPKKEWSECATGENTCQPGLVTGAWNDCLTGSNTCKGGYKQIWSQCATGENTCKPGYVYGDSYQCNKHCPVEEEIRHCSGVEDSASTSFCRYCPVEFVYDNCKKQIWSQCATGKNTCRPGYIQGVWNDCLTGSNTCKGGYATYMSQCATGHNTCVPGWITIIQ